MKKLLTLMILMGVYGSHAQPVEKYLLNLDGFSALAAMSRQEAENLNDASLAWHLIGNETKQQEIAHMWTQSVGKEDQAKAQLAAHYSNNNWEGVIELYKGTKKLDFSDHYRYLSALNSLGESKSALDELERMNLKNAPLWKLLKIDALISSKEYALASTELEKFVDDDRPLVRLYGLIWSARLQLRQRNFDQAQEVSILSRKESRMFNFTYGEAYSLYIQAVAKARTGSFKEAKELATYASVLARKAGNPSLEYSINNIISWSNFMTNEKLDLILLNESRQVELVQDLKDENRRADVYNNLGYDLTVSGSVSLDSAIALLKAANGIYAKNEGNKGRWYTLMNLTWQYRLKGEYSQSEEYASLSLKQAQSIKDRHAIIEAAFQYGETLLIQGKITEAKKFYEIGLEQRGDQNDRDAYVFDVYYSHYLWHAAHKQEAIERMKSAIDFLTTSEVFYEMHGRALLAKFYLEQKQYDLAQEQIDFFDNPRNDYIAFETKAVATTIKVELLNKSGNSLKGKAIKNSFSLKSSLFGLKVIQI